MKREALLEMHSGYQDERIAELEREVLELKAHRANDFIAYQSIEAKAKAWDDLEALVKCQEGLEIKNIFDFHDWHFHVKNSNSKFDQHSCDLKEAVSNALASIKGDDNG